MKTNLIALSGRDLKPIFAILKEQWGVDAEFPWAWYKSSKNDLFVLSRDITKIDAHKLRINSVGLYLGEYKNHEIRLSIEGSQLLGPHANKNIVELDAKELRQWLRGEDVPKEAATGFLIVKSGTDFVGCGKVKEGRMLNFVPKARRLLVSD